MSLLNVPAGKDLPEDIYVVIEIPANADPIKYEVDKESGALFVDRFMSTAMFYPCNCGTAHQAEQRIRSHQRCDRPAGTAESADHPLLRTLQRSRSWQMGKS